VEIQALGTVINAIRHHYPVKFQFDHQFSSEMEKTVLSTIHETLEERPEHIQQLVEPDLNRMVENTLKLGAVFAALDYCSEVVTDDHMEQAVSVLSRSWEQSLDFFESRYQPEEGKQQLNEAETRMLRALYGQNPKTQKEVASEIDRSQRMVREYAKTLSNLGLIRETTKDGKKAYELNEL
jgi:predicted transcriptional regulator